MRTLESSSGDGVWMSKGKMIHIRIMMLLMVV